MSSSRSSVPATTPKPVSIARHLQLVSSLATAPKTVELPSCVAGIFTLDNTINLGLSHFVLLLAGFNLTDTLIGQS